MRILAIAECGSVSEASRRLHVAQPALSKTVQFVEGYLSIRLFDRTHSGMQPTPEAIDILARASAIRGELERLERDVEAQRDSKRRRFVIGVVPVHSLNHFMRSLVELLRRLPNVDVGVEVGAFGVLKERLDAGALDFIFAPLPEHPLGATYIEEPVYDEEWVVACGNACPLKDMSAPAVQDFCAQRWIAGPPGSESFMRLAEMCRALAVPMPRIALEIDMAPARRAAVIHSDMLSIFQRAQVNSPDARVIHILLFKWPHVVRPVGTIRSSASPEGVHRAFVECFKAVFEADGLTTV